MYICHHYCCHNPLHCFVLPHVLNRLIESDDPEIRNLALDTIKHSVTSRTKL